MNSRTALLSLMLIASAICPIVCHAEGVLRFGINEANPEPYIFRDPAGKIVAGIGIELPNLIASQSGLKPVRLPISRNRIESALRDGTVDVICLVNKKWVNDVKDFHWSGAMFSTAELLVRRHDAGEVKNLQELKGQIVGTVIGYSYPPLDEALRSGVVKREDAPTELNMLKKMLAGRSRYGLIDSINYDYFLRDPANKSMFASRPLILGSNDVECGVSKKSRVPYAQLAAAFQTIARKKLAEEIVAKYRK
ncbi:MAG: transporter substrate-binding domain-containing protein [Pseudomonadota bacterium]